jgi:KaiC/GvpD/RAD55 family RecA-like ATPase
MFYSVGSFIAYWVNFACTKHPQHLGEWSWKIVVIFQMLVPVLILSQIFWIPESPRWYIQKSKNYEKARAALARVRDSDEEVDNEVKTIQEALEYEAEAVSSGYSALWKDKSVRRRMYIAMILNAGQQVTGQGTLNSYSTIIYKKVFQSADTISLINALNATFSILFTLNATWTVDRFGRKFLFIFGGIGMAICMLTVASVETQTPTIDGAKSQPVGIAIVFLMFLFAFFCNSTLPFIRILLTSHRQAVLGGHGVDLHGRDFLHERSRAGRRHVLASAEYSQRDYEPVLPHFPRQRGLLRLLHVRRHQPPFSPLCIFLCARDQEGGTGRDGFHVWRRQPRRGWRGAGAKGPSQAPQRCRGPCREADG